MPSIEFAEDNNEGEEISYTAAFEIYPELDSINLDGVEIDDNQAQVTDADIDEMLDKLREQRKTWETVERTAAEGDQVLIDFVGTLDGESEPFSGGTATDYPLELGSGRFIDGFETGLEGTAAGEEKEQLSLSFSDDYQNSELAGKAVTFKVTVKSVQEATLPEIDEEFIKLFGVDEGTMDAFRQDIRDNLERELDETLKAQLKQQVLDKLLEANTIKVPNALVESDAQHLKENTEAELAEQGISAETLNLGLDHFKERAERRVQLGVLIGEIIRHNELQPSAEKVREQVEKIASTYEQPEEVVGWFYSDQKNLKEVEASVLEDEVVAWVIEQVTVNKVEKSFAEIMHPESEAA